MGFANGDIDEVQVFNRALSPTEINQLYLYAPKWEIKYYNGALWVTIDAVKFDGSNEELNGHEELTFLIPNTAENRAFVLNDYPINLYYDGILG